MLRLAATLMHGVLLDTSMPEGTQWGPIVLALLTIIYIVFIRPLKKGKKKKDPLARSPVQNQLAQQRAVERDMGALLVEYEQMMRKMTSHIETRVAKLELLIQDADDRIKTLKEAEAASATVVARNIEPVAMAKRESSADAFARRLGEQAGPIDAKPQVEEPYPIVMPPPLHAEVYELADQGMGYRQIAQQLDRQYGEIELILALRPKDVVRDVLPTRPASTSQHADSRKGPATVVPNHTEIDEDVDAVPAEVTAAASDLVAAQRSGSGHTSGGPGHREDRQNHRRKKNRR